MSIRDMMNDKILYRDLTENIPIMNNLDNWDPSISLYGRINHRNRAIAPLDQAVMRHLGQDVFCFDFVADAFSELATHYVEKVNQGLAPYADMTSLSPVSGFKKPSTFFRRHQVKMAEVFFNQYLIKDPDNIKSFDDYVKRYMQFIKKYASVYPLLFSSYVKSKFCNLNSTGLALELEAFNHNDDKKRFSFIDDESFMFFSRLANQYGFTIPRYAPLTIVANLDSRVMMSYAIQYDIETKTDILSQYYYECVDHDIDILKRNFEEMYQVFVEEFPLINEKKVCPDGSIKEISTFREGHSEAGSPDFLNIPVHQSYWYRLYLEIRMQELKISMPKSLFDKLFKECYHIFRKYNFETSLMYAEAKILKIRPDKYR